VIAQKGFAAFDFPESVQVAEQFKLRSVRIISRDPLIFHDCPASSEIEQRRIQGYASFHTQDRLLCSSLDARSLLLLTSLGICLANLF
jgi:hypothetical protein